MKLYTHPENRTRIEIINPAGETTILTVTETTAAKVRECVSEVLEKRGILLCGNKRKNAPAGGWSRLRFRDYEGRQAGASVSLSFSGITVNEVRDLIIGLAVKEKSEEVKL
jgi:hypothetical protein